jgi:hypothetical protein
LVLDLVPVSARLSASHRTSAQPKPLVAETGLAVWSAEVGHSNSVALGIAANLLREHRRRERRQLLAYARTGVDSVFQGHSESVERLDASAAGGG